MQFGEDGRRSNHDDATPRVKVKRAYYRQHSPGLSPGLKTQTVLLLENLGWVLSRLSLIYLLPKQRVYHEETGTLRVPERLNMDAKPFVEDQS